MAPNDGKSKRHGFLPLGRRFLIMVVGVTLGVGSIVFSVRNKDPVDVDIYFGAPIRLPLWTVLLICFVLGWAIPRVLGLSEVLRARRERSRLRLRVRELEDEVIKLRNIPLDLDGPPIDSSEPQRVPYKQIESRAESRSGVVVEVIRKPSELLSSEPGDSRDDPDMRLLTDR